MFLLALMPTWANELPLNPRDRPMAIPTGFARLDGRMDYANRGIWTTLGPDLGAVVPLTDRFNMAGHVSVFGQGNAGISGIYQFNSDTVTVGITAGAELPLIGGPAAVLFGVPIWISASDMVQIQTGIDATISGDGEDVTLVAPIRAAFKLSDPGYLRVGAGLGIASGEVILPVELLASHSLPSPGGNPRAEIGVRVGLGTLYDGDNGELGFETAYAGVVLSAFLGP